MISSTLEAAVFTKKETLFFPSVVKALTTTSAKDATISQHSHQSSSIYYRCNATKIPGITFLITRYEYANLYHTLGDWWNAYFAYRDVVLLLDKKSGANKNSLVRVSNETNHRLVFMDGHAAYDPFDEVWATLFASPRMYLHDLFRQDHQTTKTMTNSRESASSNITSCHTAAWLEQAVWIPPGSMSPLDVYNRCDVHPEQMTEFVSFILDRLHLTQETRSEQPISIVLIDRKPTTRPNHPRQETKNTPRQLRNLSNVTRILQETLGNDNVIVQLVALEELSFREQVRLARRATIWIGNHGAGLTHAVFLSPGANLVEFASGGGHFAFLCRWKPEVTYHFMPSLQDYNDVLPDHYLYSFLIPTLQHIIISVKEEFLQ